MNMTSLRLEIERRFDLAYYDDSPTGRATDGLIGWASQSPTRLAATIAHLLEPLERISRAVGEDWMHGAFLDGMPEDVALVCEVLRTHGNQPNFTAELIAAFAKQPTLCLLTGAVGAALCMRISLGGWTPYSGSS
jgi:hypothetical protein